MPASRFLAAAASFAAAAVWCSSMLLVDSRACDAALPTVTVVDIGGLGHPAGPSGALAVAGGVVAGYAVTAGRNGEPNAVLSTGSGLTDVGAGLYATQAFGVNAAGVAVGQVALPSTGEPRAVIFSAGHERNLGALPGDTSSTARAINNHGVVVGTSTPSAATGYVSQAFVYRNGKMQGIPQLRNLTGFLGANATGVNDAGDVVGSVGVKAFFAGATSSYVVRGGTATLFATIHGNGNSQATAINAAGIVVGYHSTFSFSVNAPVHAYTFAQGVLTDLGTLYPADAFALSGAFAINSAAVAVGFSQHHGTGFAPVATAFTNGKVIDLNTLLPAHSGWVLQTAYGIDDAGNIVGVGVHDTIARGFLLRTGSRFVSH